MDIGPSSSNWMFKEIRCDDTTKYRIVKKKIEKKKEKKME